MMMTMWMFFLVLLLQDDLEQNSAEDGETSEAEHNVGLLVHAQNTRVGVGDEKEKAHTKAVV